MNALDGIKSINVLSQSNIKREAVMRWLRITKRRHLRVYFVEPAETGCPQPFGAHSALQCLSRRLPPLDRKTGAMWIGIENYIVCTAHGAWLDYVAVSATYVTANGLVLTVSSRGQFGNHIPPQYVPQSGPDLHDPYPLGYSQTVGERIEAANPHIPHDDWGVGVCPTNIPRTTQIVDALRVLDEKINSFVRSS